MNEYDQNSQRMKRRGANLQFDKDNYKTPTANTQRGESLKAFLLGTGQGNHVQSQHCCST